jgi:hypothetical protein
MLVGTAKLALDVMAESGSEMQRRSDRCAFETSARLKNICTCAADPLRLSQGAAS